MHVCKSENANLRRTYGQNTVLGPDLTLGFVTQCYVFYPVCVVVCISGAHNITASSMNTLTVGHSVCQL